MSSQSRPGIVSNIMEPSVIFNILIFI